MKAKKHSNTVKTDLRKPRLREKDEAIRELIEDKLNYLDRYTLQIIGNITSADEKQPPWSEKKNPKRANRIEIEKEEWEQLHITRDELNIILRRLEREKRVNEFGITSRIASVWTTPDLWVNPGISGLDIDFDRKTRSLIIGIHKIKIVGRLMINASAEIVERSKKSNWGFVDEDDILDAIYNEEDTADKKHSLALRHAVIRLNRKIEKKVGKKGFFFQEGSKIRVNV